jgi:hypothetical protein
MQITTRGETVDIHDGAQFVDISTEGVKCLESISDVKIDTYSDGSLCYRWKAIEVDTEEVWERGVYDCCLEYSPALYNLDSECVKSALREAAIAKRRLPSFLYELDPDFVAEWYRKEETPDRDIGCGMVLNHGRPFILINRQTGKARQLVSANRKLCVADSDIDFDRIYKMEHCYGAKNKSAKYGFRIYSRYENGLCVLEWTVYPDGFYFRDADGYGAEDNDEQNVYCVINTDLEIVVPFQPMEDMREALNTYNHSLQ